MNDQQVVPEELEGMQGAFVDSLVRNNKQIKKDRAIAIAESLHMKYKRKVEDLEQDTWLTRLYIEGGGGGNAGESYLLAWYFAAMHTATDAWDKRKEKGFIFTVGDEPCLKHLPANVIMGLIGGQAGGALTREQLLSMAQERYHVYHIFIEHSSSRRCDAAWREMFGENLIVTSDYKEVPKLIAEVVYNNVVKSVGGDASIGKVEPQKETDSEPKIRL